MSKESLDTKALYLTENPCMRPQRGYEERSNIGLTGGYLDINISVDLKDLAQNFLKRRKELLSYRLCSLYYLLLQCDLENGQSNGVGKQSFWRLVKAKKSCDNFFPESHCLINKEWQRYEFKKSVWEVPFTSHFFVSCEYLEASDTTPSQSRKVTSPDILRYP